MSTKSDQGMYFLTAGTVFILIAMQFVGMSDDRGHIKNILNLSNQNPNSPYVSDFILSLEKCYLNNCSNELTRIRDDLVYFYFTPALIFLTMGLWFIYPNKNDALSTVTLYLASLVFLSIILLKSLEATKITLLLLLSFIGVFYFQNIKKHFEKSSSVNFPPWLMLGGKILLFGLIFLIFLFIFISVHLIEPIDFSLLVGWDNFPYILLIELIILAVFVVIVGKNYAHYLGK